MALIQFFFLTDLMIFDKDNRDAMKELEAYQISIQESSYEVIAFGNATNLSMKNIFYYGKHAFENLSIAPYLDIEIFIETEFSAYENLYFYRDANTNELIEPLQENEVLITKNAADQLRLKVGDFIEVVQNPSGDFVDRFQIRNITQSFFDVRDPNPNDDKGLIVFPFQQNLFEFFPDDFSSEKFQHVVFSSFGLSNFFYTQVDPYRTRIIKEPLRNTTGLDISQYSEISQVEKINQLTERFMDSKLSIFVPVYTLCFIAFAIVEFKDYQHIRKTFHYGISEQWIFKFSRSIWSILFVLVMTILSLGFDILVYGKIFRFFLSLMQRNLLYFMLFLTISVFLFALPSLFEYKPRLTRIRT